MLVLSVFIGFLILMVIDFKSLNASSPMHSLIRANQIFNYDFRHASVLSPSFSVSAALLSGTSPFSSALALRPLLRGFFSVFPGFFFCIHFRAFLRNYCKHRKIRYLLTSSLGFNRIIQNHSYNNNTANKEADQGISARLFKFFKNIGACLFRRQPLPGPQSDSAVPFPSISQWNRRQYWQHSSTCRL